jgi:hypothetical protein
MTDHDRGKVLCQCDGCKEERTEALPVNCYNPNCQKRGGHEGFCDSLEIITDTGRIKNACQAASETHRSWESRCYAIMTALGQDYGELNNNDYYLYKDIEDFQSHCSYTVNDAFKMGWNMARTPSSILGEG